MLTQLNESQKDGLANAEGARADRPGGTVEAMVILDPSVPRSGLA